MLRLGPNVVCLTRESRHTHRGKAEVYLVGTAHVSKESCDEVADTILKLKPEVVFLELCPARSGMLTASVEQMKDASISVWDVVSGAVKGEKDVFSLIFGMILSKSAVELEVFPGEEFRTAFQTALACGSDVHLGDRPIQLTLLRLWRSLSRWQILRFVTSLLLQSLWFPSARELREMLEMMKDRDLLELALKDLGSAYPEVLAGLVHERDLFMTHCLQVLTLKYSRVVAVVGRGHVAGIVSNWGRDDIDVQALVAVPPPRAPLFSPRLKLILLVSSVALSTVCIAVARARR